MHHLLLKPIAGSLLLGACAGVLAQGTGGLFDDYRKVSSQGKTAHIVDIDNDSLLLNRDDGFYSSGMRYTRTHTLDATTYGWRVGQELYTASDIKWGPELVGPPDHPYAGWLYGGFFKQTARADGGHVRLGIDIGCLGPCAGGEWTQTNFHKLLNQPEPQAWSKQVKNELGVVLHAEYAPLRWTPSASMDITPSVKARFGNIYTDAGVGLKLRAGQFDRLPHDSTYHGFLHVDARAVGYNAMLQGGYFSKNNPHTVDPKRLVGEIAAGVAWNHGPFGARLALVRRGNEIRALSQSIGAQSFLHLQFSYTP